MLAEGEVVVVGEGVAVVAPGDLVVLEPVLPDGLRPMPIPFIFLTEKGSPSILIKN